MGEKRMKRKRKRVKEKSDRAVILTKEEVFRISIGQSVVRDFIFLVCVRDNRGNCGSCFWILMMIQRRESYDTRTTLLLLLLLLLEGDNVCVHFLCCYLLWCVGCTKQWQLGWVWEWKRRALGNKGSSHFWIIIYWEKANFAVKVNW